MKTATSRIAAVMVCAIGALVKPPLSLADSFSGSLGAGDVNIEPTDVYALTCPIGTASVRARASTNQADQIVVQVINPNGLARTAVSLPGPAPKPTAVLSGRAGNYLVTVHKVSNYFPSVLQHYLGLPQFGWSRLCKYPVGVGSESVRLY